MNREQNEEDEESRREGKNILLFYKFSDFYFKIYNCCLNSRILTVRFSLYLCVEGGFQMVFGWVNMKYACFM